MRKQISFAIAAATAGLAIAFWARASVLVTSDANFIQLTEELSLMSNPYLPIRESEPIY
jgi:hypothetical protein